MTVTPSSPTITLERVVLSPDADLAVIESELLPWAQLQRRAFYPSQIHQRIFGKVKHEDMDNRFLERMKELLLEQKGAQVRFVKAMRGQELLGFAMWSVRGVVLDHGEGESGLRTMGKNEDKPIMPFKRKVAPYPPGTNVELAKQMFEGEPAPKEGPHWYLNILVTDPQFQRSGAGTALLAWGTRQADHARVRTYLKATVEGMSVYKRGGFTPYGEPDKAGNDGELVLQPMVRQPLA
ncbi:hypothetical protein T439DRAFT_383610 [Meredithblackwellia eburnea MCA 4105]